MYSSKLNLVFSRFVIILVSLLILSSCGDKETKARRLCKKWIYSPKTIKEKKDKIAQLSQSSNSMEQLAGTMGNEMFNILETSTFEFESTGNYTVSNSNDGFSILMTQSGFWEYDDSFKHLAITLQNKKEIYEIKELTENTLVLSYIKEGQEVVEGFIPFTKIKPVKTKENNASSINESKIIDESKIIIESFKYSKDILFGYFIKKDATNKEYLFVRNEDENDNKEVIIKINGQLINLKFEKEGNISKTIFFQEYKSKEYIVRIEYKVNQTLEEYNNKLEATIIISKDGNTKAFENLYAESIFD